VVLGRRRDEDAILLYEELPAHASTAHKQRQKHVKHVEQREASAPASHDQSLAYKNGLAIVFVGASPCFSKSPRAPLNFA